MLRSSAVFDALALPYDLLTRHPVWQRHRERMAQELPEGARHILDLGCGPGISTGKLPAGTVGGTTADVPSAPGVAKSPPAGMGSVPPVPVVATP